LGIGFVVSSIVARAWLQVIILSITVDIVFWLEGCIFCIGLVVVSITVWLEFAVGIVVWLEFSAGIAVWLKF
jgi:hypothetical protein